MQSSCVRPDTESKSRRNTDAYLRVSGLEGEGMAAILIVDDDSAIRALLRGILEEDGHQIREAGNGHIGLAL